MLYSLKNVSVTKINKIVMGEHFSLKRLYFATLGLDLIRIIVNNYTAEIQENRTIKS